jgi:hypothetical protein
VHESCDRCERNAETSKADAAITPATASTKPHKFCGMEEALNGNAEGRAPEPDILDSLVLKEPEWVKLNDEQLWQACDSLVVDWKYRYTTYYHFRSKVREIVRSPCLRHGP